MNKHLFKKMPLPMKRAMVHKLTAASIRDNPGMAEMMLSALVAEASPKTLESILEVGKQVAEDRADWQDLANLGKVQ